MKRLKKILALALAMAMVLSMGTMSAFAAGETGARTLDGSITVKGLQDGDTVTFHQILKWNNGWVAADGVNLTTEELATVIGTKDTPGAISYAVAQKLAGQNIAAKYPASGTLTAASGQVSQASPEAGLYMAIITPGKAGYVYNPVFVAADYDQPATGDDTNEWTVDLSKSYSDNAYAKKQPITLDKTAKDAKTVDTNDSETVAVGDTVTFTVNTVIPGFKDKHYTNPVFKITDVLSEGLDLNLDSVTVTAPTGLTKNSQYTVAKEGSGYILNFAPNYLQTLAAPTEVTITYTAKVNDKAQDANVNHEDNTVTLNYSNNPSDEEGHGTLKDKTNHYTFDIDADVLGSTPYKNTEVVKIGVDKDGNEITKTTELANGNKVGALQGAEFALYDTEDNAKAKGENGKLKTASSDVDGRINIKGLDAGTYWLMETKAPDGYIAATDPVKIEIVPTIEEVTVTEGTGNDAVTYKTNILKSYVVKVNDVTTASYTVTPQGTVSGDGKSISYTNPAEATQIKEINAGDQVGNTNVGDDDNSGKIKNVQGVALPSTGGIGTTIFYTIGAILVIGASVVMITRRRMDA